MTLNNLRAEQFLASSQGSYIVGTFDKANIVIGSGLFVSDGFTGQPDLAHRFH